jgi:hypothetical protein
MLPVSGALQLKTSAEIFREMGEMGLLWASRSPRNMAGSARAT